MPESARSYTLDGTVLEVCSCESTCPCSAGDDPDGGTCSTISAYHIDHGTIDTVDVADLSLVEVCQVPGNVHTSRWRVALYIDDKATRDQREALLAAFTGERGGHLAELAPLKQYIAVEDCPIEFRVEGGKSILRVTNRISAVMELNDHPEGRPAPVRDGPCGTTPGATGHLATSSEHRVSAPEHGMVWELTGRNALQGTFHFEG
jgi:hypothetical protein